MCFSALHWVSIEMLCVPVDEKLPKVSDSVERAITGTDIQLLLLFLRYSYCHDFLLNDKT